MRGMPTVLFDVDDSIATIRLNNAERHNSLGADELTALHDCLDRIEFDNNIRVMLLTGEGERTFCAGAALDQLTSGAISPELFAGMTRKLATLRVPSVCALNGSVYGGGCEIALSCDFRFGHDRIRAFVPAAKFGLCYPVSGIERLVATLGLSAAQRFLLAAEEFNAADLLTMGFLTQLLTEAEVYSTAKAYAETLATRGPLAVQAMKTLSLQAANKQLDSAQAQQLMQVCNESADLQEGLLAAKEKRQPIFTGR